MEPSLPAALTERAVSAARNGVVITDPYRPDNPIIYYNRAFQELTGYAAEEILGRNCRFLQGPGTDAAAVAEMRDALRAGRECLVTLQNYRRDGTPFWNELTISPVWDTAGRLTHFIGVQADVTERVLLEQERERLLAGAEARAEHEALLGRIGLAIRSTLSPQAVQAAAAAVLGEALGADRCYFVLYEESLDLVRVGSDWHRPDLPSLAGEYRLSDHASLLGGLFRDAATAVVLDVHLASLAAAHRAALTGFGLRSVVAVPFYDAGQLAAALFIGMADVPRAWTKAEVELAETVASQTRGAVQLAQAGQRALDVAAMLQQALLPPVPERMPGLSLGHFYRAALAEASIGGDFLDVFTLGNGCTALVVGDVSGKGLAAAAQLATIRNMLRATLYLGNTLADAVAALNSIVTANDLLPGFVTLFVGAYDAATRRLAYVSCGHEPGLVRRAGTGAIETLDATGPLLGILSTAVYEEHETVLGAGDLLLLYTDGVSEAGVDRREMLGADGLARLLAGQDPADGAQAAVSRLLAQVMEFSQGIQRDDICMLAALAGQ